MPVSESALERAGLARSTSVVHGHLAKHVQMNHDTTLRFLGDVIPLSWFRSVVSPGDVLMAIGISLLVAAAMRSITAANDPVAPSPSVPLRQFG
jgi:Na+/H+-dicarboxylate symporter